MTIKLTISSARSILSAHGCTLKVNDREYRVTLKNHPRPEAIAYYTNDLQDAIDTGKAMALEAKRQDREQVAA